ncbi:hypothetical protein ACJZ2D_011732 [Fusarium nematophilum]
MHRLHPPSSELALTGVDVGVERTLPFWAPGSGGFSNVDAHRRTRNPHPERSQLWHPHPALHVPFGNLGLAVDSPYVAAPQLDPTQRSAAGLTCTPITAALGLSVAIVLRSVKLPWTLRSGRRAAWTVRLCRDQHCGATHLVEAAGLGWQFENSLQLPEMRAATPLGAAAAPRHGSSRVNGELEWESSQHVGESSCWAPVSSKLYATTAWLQPMTGTVHPTLYMRMRGGRCRGRVTLGNAETWLDVLVHPDPRHAGVLHAPFFTNNHQNVSLVSNPSFPPIGRFELRLAQSLQSESNSIEVAGHRTQNSITNRFPPAPAATTTVPPATLALAASTKFLLQLH